MAVPLRARRPRPAVGLDLTSIGDFAGTAIGVPAAGNVITQGVSFIEHLGGLLGLGGVTAADQARSARCNSYYIGAVAGIVDSARLLMGRMNEGIPSKELNMYQQAVSRLQSARPDVYSAAVAAGPLHDVNYPGSSAGDGQKGLALLLQYKIGYNQPYMGTDDGKVVNQQTQTIVQQLKQLAATPAMGTSPGYGVIPPGQVVSGGGLGDVLTNLQKPSLAGLPLWMVLGIAGAAVYYLVGRNRQ